MALAGLDHVNIVTDRLEETLDFYSSLLGLERGVSPATAMGLSGAWLQLAGGGQAIIHLIEYNPAHHDAEGFVPGTATGSFNHVALACSGFAETLARAREMGLATKVYDRDFSNARQIFVHDPNGVRVELNFQGD